MTKRLAAMILPTFLMLLPCNGEAKEKPPDVSSVLSLDFGAEETAGPVQAGYFEWAGPYVGNPGLNYNETRSFEADFGEGGVVDVTVQSDGLFFRDYEAIVGGAFVDQSALLSDSILRIQPGSIVLTFSSLRDGVEQMAREAGARVVTADGVAVEDTPEGILLRGLMDLFAQYERAVIRARTRAALAVIRSRGEQYTRRAPLGYRFEDGRLVEDPAERAALARVRELKARGISTARAASILNAEGLRCRGGRWHVTTLARALRRAA